MTQDQLHRSGVGPLVSVIIVGYNALSYLRTCIESVLDSSYPRIEVIFIDNGSHDGSYDHACKIFGTDSRCKILETGANMGTVGGNIVGARQATGEYLYFLNVDTRVDSAFIANALSVARSDKDVGAVQSKVLMMRDPKLVDCVANVMDEMGDVYSVGNGEMDSAWSNIPGVRFFATSCALLVRKNAFEQIGGFDEDFFMYYDDLDLCWRLGLYGYRILFAPDSVVFHVGQYFFKDSSQRYVRRLASYRSTFLTVRNKLFTLTKNESLSKLIEVAPLVVFQSILTGLMAVIKERNTTRLQATLMGYLSYLANSRPLWKKRAVVQSNRIDLHAVLRRPLIHPCLLISKIRWVLVYRRRLTLFQFLNRIYMGQIFLRSSK